MTNVERFTKSLASKEARLERTRERMAKRAAGAEARLAKAREALAKAQARVEAAEAALAKAREDAEALITKQTDDVSKARERLEAARATAQAMPAKSAARVTTAPRASRSKDWVVSHEAGGVVVPPGIRSSLNAFLGRKARVTLDNEFAGRLFDVLGIDQATTLLLTIPGRKGYVATVVEDGLEFVRE
jgi:hypothetical protein